MNRRQFRYVSATLGVITIGLLGYGASASATSTPPVLTSAKTHPVFMPTVEQRMKLQQARQAKGKSVQPPSFLACLPTHPLPGVPVPVLGTVDPNCVPPGPGPAGEPWPGNMAYFGGHVQVQPKIYMIYYGWNQKGAFNAPCGHEAGFPACDPDGAGLRMLNFVKQMGGTTWAGVQTQYYQTVTKPDGSTFNQYIDNPVNQFGGVWFDDKSPITHSLSYTQIAQEAERGVRHFGLASDKAALLNAQFIVVQPRNYEDGAFLSTGYCAWHDYTQPNIEGGIYNKVLSGISFTNMPYILRQGSSCGQGSVNSGANGTLDGASIVLGHEIEETVTDPGAEDVPSGQLSQTSLGGWYDAEQYENGDKCAWVGVNGTGQGPNSFPIPGVVGNMKGNKGDLFPVQSLWSNQAAQGLGYCAGAGTDLPGTPVPPL